MHMSQETRAAFKRAGNNRGRGAQQQWPQSGTESQRVCAEEHAQSLIDEACHQRNRGHCLEDVILSSPPAQVYVDHVQRSKISLLFLSKCIYKRESFVTSINLLNIVLDNYNIVMK